MKQALLILSVLGMGIAQTSGAVETTFQSNNTLTHTITNITAASNYGSSQNIYSTNSGARVYSNDEISQAIDNLSEHAKQKEYQLASLTSRLAYEREQQIRNSIPDSNSAPARAAASAARAAHARSTGYCARYVRKALQSAGYEFTPNPSAYQYATRGTLAKAGFTKISNDMQPQVGDVVVFDRTSRRPHGHIQIFDGNGWVSDFRQKGISPYSGVHSYTTWRDSQYVDDASDRGIYLAMADE
ncbi:CHAP domain-containing protein [uncultured Psychrobacter sp.]|uniref:CHAP domain-containing protein n=1 Tax=uncultured Psychrobacter sp. TaxID=259303 RepID=UPI00261A2AF8|nr:CHAP domain-containing protein [uncultured Psychrobacter sp.]